MSDDGYPHVPSGHVRLQDEGHALFVDPAEPADHVGFLQLVTSDVLEALQALLSYSPAREIAVCCYASNEQARACLDRHVDATMALAPYADDTRGLVVLQSREAHPQNGDDSRMRRVLCHEMAHLLAWEITGSTKLLGDDNSQRWVPAWLDEGFAAVCSHLTFGDGARLEQATERFARSRDPMTFGGLSRELDDLGSPARREAFTHATAAVSALVQRRGVTEVFPHLADIAAELGEDETCTPERIIKAARMPWGR